MSQIVEAERPEVLESANDPVESTESTSEVRSEEGSADGYGEFDYKPVPVLAPLSLVFGVCSISAWFLLPAMGVALLGTVIGAVAVRKIVASEGELGGRTLASIGFVLSAVLLCAGTAKHAYVIATEVPEGYERVHFVSQISKYPVEHRMGQALIAQPVADLEGQDIFVKGYIFPTQHKEGLTSFLLVKDNQACCFGPGNVQPNDMIHVQMRDGKTIDYKDSRVSVAGTFHLVRRTPGQQMLTNGVNPIVYRLEADLVEVSKTSF